MDAGICVCVCGRVDGAESTVSPFTSRDPAGLRLSRQTTTRLSKNKIKKREIKKRSCLKKLWVADIYCCRRGLCSVKKGIKEYRYIYI